MDEGRDARPSPRDVTVRIREFREIAGLSQSQLAADLGLNQATVSGWESGRRQPRLEDLYAVADALDVDVSRLLTATARRPLRAVLRAAVADLDEESLPQELEMFAAEADRRVRPPVHYVVQSRRPLDAAEELLEVAGVRSAPVDVDGIIEGCGIPLIGSHLPAALSGLVVETDGGPVIGVNSTQPAVRQRFTAAHELGHVLLGHLSTVHIDLVGVGYDHGEPPNYDWRQEKAANNFAASLLMPARLVRQVAGTTKDTKRLASEFQVSAAAMGFRLRDLSLA
jgi:transcriptional regulator with XRE-family HTH domain